MWFDPPQNEDAVMNNSQNLQALESMADNGEIDPEMILEQILADDNLSQQITRTQNDGVDSVVAYFRCRFKKGQQRVTVHLPLAPAMEQAPKTQAIAVDHDQAVVRVTDRHKFGLRAEAVLPREADCETFVMIELIATSPASET